MKKIIEDNFLFFNEKGQIVLDKTYFHEALKTEILNHNNIFKNILENKITKSAKNSFNKRKTILEKGIIKIKNKNNSEITIRIKQKNDTLAFKIIDLKLNDYEKDYFFNNTEISMLGLMKIISEYMIEISKITKKHINELKNETEKLSKLINKE